jgi:fructose transport system permease protein
MTQPQAQTAGAGAEGGQSAPPESDGGGGGRAIPKVSGDRVAQLGPLIALVLACIFFTTQSDRFLDPTNFSLIIQQVMVVGTLAIGQTLIILTAGIDLSCGTAMALGSIVMTKLAVSSNVPPVLAILLGIVVCAIIGFVNGGLVVGLSLPPFIVTLGTFSICLALTHIYSKDETISTLPHAMTKLGESFKIGSTAVTYGSLVTLALFAFIWFVLTQTTWGRRVYALGDAPEATRLMGIPVRKQLLMVYVVAGVIYGIAALLLIARTNVGDPNAGQTDNLDAITAVVLGGTSLFGGRGTVIGTLIGALIIGVVRNGLVLMGVASTYQILITGILVIVAVSVDQIARKRG